MGVAVWSEFFAAWKTFVPAAPQKVAPEVDSIRFAQFFALGSYILEKFRASGEAVTMWEVAGLGRDEVRTCSALAWLLDCYGSHGQGDAFLRCFFECVDADAPQRQTTAEAIAKGYRTRVEKVYDAQTEGPDNRVDIEINGPGLLLFIEAKIGASEGNDQLRRYLDVLRATAGNRKRALVFVTPTGRPPEVESVAAQSEITSVSWRTLAARFLRHIETMPKNAKNSFGIVFIRQFCEHIKGF